MRYAIRGGTAIEMVERGGVALLFPLFNRCSPVYSLFV